MGRNKKAVNKMTTQFEFEVFHGQLTPSLAHIYARVSSLPGGGLWTLSGQLRGPDCLFAKTLPATTLFVDAGHGPTLLAKATLTDPCFWSIDVPFLYRLKIELRNDGRLIANHEQLWGPRFLGCRQRNFYWMNQRWVLRGVFRESVTDAPLSAWRDLATAMVVETPDEDLCLEASRHGVVLVAIVPASASAPTEVRRLAKWPAVAIVLFTSPLEATTELQSLAPNTILGTDSSQTAVETGKSSHAAMVDAEAMKVHVPPVANKQTPLIICRRLQNKVLLEEARAACDALQRDVVHHGDFAGYVV